MVLGFLAGIAAIVVAVAYRREKKRKLCQCGGRLPNGHAVTDHDHPYHDQPNTYPREKGYYGNSENVLPEYERGSGPLIRGDNKLQYRNIPVTDEKNGYRMGAGEMTEYAKA